MEDQGIMGLQQGQPQGGPSGEQLLEAAATVSPKDFAKGTMESLRMQDPESAAIVDQIMSMPLPAELVDSLLELISGIIANPQQYQQIRQEAIAEGIPEEFFPPEFDIEFFQMLKMALEAAPRSEGMPAQPETVG